MSTTDPKAVCFHVACEADSNEEGVGKRTDHLRCYIRLDLGSTTQQETADENGLRTPDIILANAGLSTVMLTQLQREASMKGKLAPGAEEWYGPCLLDSLRSSTHDLLLDGGGGR